MFQLRSWQIPKAQRILEILKERHICLDCSGTGTGKTFTGAWVAAQLGLPVLVVCPKSVTSLWPEILKDAGARDVTALNPEKLKTGRYGWFKDGRWTFTKETFIIWDEIHNGTQGAYTDTTAMAAKLKAFTTLPKLLLSATVADSPLQMRATGFLFGLHSYQDAAFWDWCLRLGCQNIRHPDGRGGWRNDIMMPKAQYKSKEIMMKVREALTPFMVRTTPDEIPDFPQTEIVAKLFELDSLTAEDKRLYAQWADRHTTLSKDERAQMTVARQRTEIMKVPLLAQMVKDIVAEGRSAVVFTNFLEPMTLLAMALGESNVVQIRGGQSDAVRQSAVARFQSNEINICLAQSQAGGVSIGLHDIHNVRPRTSLLCPSWDAKVTRQCLGRIHRDSGTKTVQLFVLAKGTIEEGVKRAIDRKSKNLDTLNDGDMEGVS